jgi:hypothetical protein
MFVDEQVAQFVQAIF